jgi:hypothetical protein
MSRRSKSHHSKSTTGFAGLHPMNTGNTDATQLDRTPSGRTSRTPVTTDELSRLKHELMQAEVRLAKARATVVSAEIDIKVINTHLKAFMK